MTVKLDLKALDGIRAVASITVFLGHFFTFWAPNDGSRVPSWGIEYLSPVTLFFVISGFTFVAVYNKSSTTKTSVAQQPLLSLEDGQAQTPSESLSGDKSPLSTWSERKTFFWKRVARLAPVYYTGLAIGLAPLIVYNDTTAIAQAVPVALFWLQSIATVGAQWDGPLWTVSAFACCYIFFVFTLSTLRRLQTRTLAWILILSCIVSILVGCIWVAFVSKDYVWILHSFFAFRIPHFLAGMCAGFIAQRITFSATVSTIVAEACTVLLVLDQVGCMVFSQLLPEDDAFWGWFTWMFVVEFIIPFLHVLWIVSLCSPNCGGITKWFFTTKPLKMLGNYSYALYCLHFPVLSWISWAVAAKGVSFDAVPMDNGSYGNFPPWASVPALIVCLGVAALAYHTLEAPARKVIVKKVSTEAENEKVTAPPAEE